MLYRWKKLCVNYRGTHGAEDEMCQVRERQVEVARIRVVQKVLYAEAAKRVVESDRNNMCFSNVVFLALMAMVVNCTVGMELKSQRIDVVAAAEKYLGV